MANNDYESQIEKLDQEIARRQERKKELIKKRNSADRKKQNSIKYQLGGVIRKWLDRPLTEADVENLDRFLYGQEHNKKKNGEEGHFFTSFMNNPAYQGSPNQPDGTEQGMNTQKEENADTGDSMDK